MLNEAQKGKNRTITNLSVERIEYVSLYSDVLIKNRGLLNLYVSQIFCSLITIMSMNPNLIDVRKIGIYDSIKKLRKKVIFDKRAKMRIRAFVVVF